MHFATKKRSSNLPPTAPMKFNDTDIETVKSFRYLGLMIDMNLSWEEHIMYVATKMRQIVGILHKGQRIIPTKIRTLIYRSMIDCHLRYMIELWGSAAICHLKRLQIIQNAAMRNLYNLPFLSPRLSLYPPTSRILPVLGMYRKALAEFVFKKQKDDLHSEIRFHPASHNYNSRHRDLLKIPRSKLTLCQGRVSVSGAITFNDLPQELKCNVNLGTFKRNILRHYHCIRERFLVY